MKAVWRSLLDQLWPEATLIAGIHDTDYFAKTTALIETDAPYEVLPHNDGATRGLWSAAGELSALFGSEDVPAKAVYESYGIPFARLARASDSGRGRFQDEVTEAWGWRGIIATTPNPPIAHDVPLNAFGPALLEQLDWGFTSSLEQLGRDGREASQASCQTILDSVRNFIGDHGRDGTLTDLYRFLLPRFYETLLGAEPKNFLVANSVELFRFDCATYDRPRFAVLDLFLDAATRALCVDAYNRAVAGGGMYTLETFGEGALPFDVVLPGHGRGTLRIDGDGVHVEWRGQPQKISGPEPVWNRAKLAHLLECELGDGVALVGKAVSLIDMLAGEFIVVFHETASGYTARTVAMNQVIRAAGLPLQTMPIVRLAYPTWDALEKADVATPLFLPGHLARAFGSEDAPLPARELGKRWREVVVAQEAVLRGVRARRKPRETMRLLADAGGTSGTAWASLANEYENMQAAIRTNAARCADIKMRLRAVRAATAQDRKALVETERAKGEDFRTTLANLIERRRLTAGEEAAKLDEQIAAESARRALAYDAVIDGCRNRLRNARSESKRLRNDCRKIERSQENVWRRGRISDILRKTEMARLMQVHDAFLTAHSLPHANARPSSWWLPLIDPSGAWFQAIAAGTEARLEEV